ncbi:MAG: meso-butanediol dehydrogenase / (S,S)-butanediol dehydrogenase / diacetyl reductase [Solirubrobacteraceae bacterium]|jgi:NAD(P)-dependent dehydrogenase (short-subunit alcohol dehydrogenase family)|nr:meso-butanediol dehydrogenase / (S,S)-butanediol dehydrogenase / diacetyl reductase [Solirubrobacteraceae bacterium]
MTAEHVAVVTGAGRGIGEAVAARLAADGFRVVGIDRLPGTDLTLDVGDRDAVLAAFASLERVDVVVNCAMWIRYAHIAEVQEETVDTMLAVGLKSLFWTTQAALEPMRAAGGGSIVHFASPAALHGFPTAGVYSAIKGAVVSFTRQSAVELAPDNIRVNAVVPGAIPTPGAREVVDDAGYEYRRRRTPLGRLGTPEDIAGGVAFLASPDAAFMTGQLLVLDGGITVA